MSGTSSFIQHLLATRDGNKTEEESMEIRKNADAGPFEQVFEIGACCDPQMLTKEDLMWCLLAACSEPTILLLRVCFKRPLRMEDFVPMTRCLIQLREEEGFSAAGTMLSPLGLAEGSMIISIFPLTEKELAEELDSLD